MIAAAYIITTAVDIYAVAVNLVFHSHRMQFI